MADAKTRREKYFAEWLRTEPKIGLIAKMAKKHKMHPVRMSQILARARQDQVLVSEEVSDEI